MAVYNHLIDSYQEFGDSFDEAELRAGKRLRGIEARLHDLARMPFQGTLLPRIWPALRRATKDDAVIYFTVDEAEEQVHVLAIFFSGQDHLPQIMARLKGARG